MSENQYGFRDVFGPAPNLAHYRDDLRLRQKVVQRYDQMERDFRGVKAVVSGDQPLSEQLDLQALTPEQATAVAQAHRAAVKLGGEALLCVFDWDQFPVRAVMRDVRMLGGSDRFPFREPRPWLLPVKAGQSVEAFDKTIASEVADAVKRGETFFFLDMGLFPAGVRQKNQENIEALLADGEAAGVADMASL